MTDGSVEYNIRTKRVGCKIRRATASRENDISKRVDVTMFFLFLHFWNQSMGQSIYLNLSIYLFFKSIYCIYLNLGVYFKSIQFYLILSSNSII